MNIGIIGAGKVGGTLGRAFAKAGHSVAYGARDPAADAPELRHERSSVVSVRDAVTVSELVVLCTPWAATADALAAAGDFGGKVLVDVTNPIGPQFRLTHGHTDSGAEQVARWAKNAVVVKAFNVTGAENMGDPRYGDHKVAAFVCSNEPSASATVARLGAELGFDVTEIGELEKARLLEPLAMLWIHMAMKLGKGRGMAFGLLRR